jgi:hypothetical protein
MRPDDIEAAAREYEAARLAAAETEWERCGRCDRPYTQCTCCPFCAVPDPEGCWSCWMSEREAWRYED